MHNSQKYNTSEPSLDFCTEIILMSNRIQKKAIRYVIIFVILENNIFWETNSG